MYIFIPSEIIQLLLFQKECFSCMTTYKYFIGYIWCLLLVQGRKTTRNMYRYCFFFKKDVSSWCRFLTQYHWNYNDIIEKTFDMLISLFAANFEIHEAILSCYDSTLIAKESKNVQGIQVWNNHSGNADAGEHMRGHHWGVLSIIARFNKKYVSFILSFRLITGKSINYQWKCSENGIERLKIWDVAHAQIFQLNQWCLKYNKKQRVVADAYFSNKPFIQPLINKNIHVVTRLKDNGVAYLDPEPQPEGKRGPKPKNGKKIKVFDLVKMQEPETIQVQLYGKLETLQVVTSEIKTLDLTQKVKVVIVIRGCKKKTAFISTDLTLPAAQIIEIYGARFSIEIAIKDMKQHLGLCDYQHQDLLPVMRHLHMVGVAYNIAKSVLLKYPNSKLLAADFNEGVTPWTSEYSISRVRYCLKRYCLGNLISKDFAKTAESENLPLDKDAIFKIAL